MRGNSSLALVKKYKGRTLTADAMRKLQRFRWQEFVADFDGLKENEALVFSPEKFGMTPTALTAALTGALTHRKYYVANPILATVRKLRDGTVIVAKARPVNVRRSAY